MVDLTYLTGNVTTGTHDDMVNDEVIHVTKCYSALLMTITTKISETIVPLTIKVFILQLIFFILVKRDLLDMIVKQVL